MPGSSLREMYDDSEKLIHIFFLSHSTIFETYEYILSNESAFLSFKIVDGSSLHKDFHFSKWQSNDPFQNHHGNNLSIKMTLMQNQLKM